MSGKTIIVILVVLLAAGLFSCKKSQQGRQYQWVKVKSDFTGTQVLSIAFVSKDTGFAVGYPIYDMVNHISKTPWLTTTDGGNTWKTDTLNIHDGASSGAVAYSGVLYAGARLGVLSKSGFRDRMFRSTDKGQTWQTLDSTSRYFAITFWDTQNGIALNLYKSGVYQTTDGGFHYTQSQTIGTYAFGSIVTSGASSAYVFDDDPNTINNVIYRTTNKGASWAPLSYSFQAITQVCFPSAAVGYVFQHTPFGDLIAEPSKSSLVKTTDGGNTWQVIDDNLSGKYGTPYDAEFDSENMGSMLVGNAIYGTTDGAKTWQLQFQGSNTQILTGFYVAPGGAVYVYGSDIYKRTAVLN